MLTVFFSQRLVRLLTVRGLVYAITRCITVLLNGKHVLHYSHQA